MRCRECGLELEERDQLRNGAFQCPECGTIHHTASSSRVSPSPWRRKRRSALPSGDNVLMRKIWLLPLWSWIAIALVVVAALVLLLTFGGKASDPAEPSMPVPQDIPLNGDQDAPEDSTENDSPTTDAENALLSELEGETAVSTKHTGVKANDFVVSFEWAMSYLNYTSHLNKVSEETGPGGQLIQTYRYEDWFDVVLTLDPETSNVRTAVATATEGATDDDTLRMTAAFVCTLYGLDNTLNANAGKTEIEAMIADNAYVYSRNPYTASLSHSEFAGYTLEINGRL